MKGALILNGQLRGYKKCIPHLFKNLLDINDIDIFISTEKNDKVNENLCKQEIIETYKNRVKKITFIHEIDFSEYKDFIIENFKKLNIYNLDRARILLNTTSFNEFKKKFLLNLKIHGSSQDTYKLCKNKEGYNYSERELMIIIHLINGIKLVKQYVEETGIKYDYVLIYRPDLFFEVPLHIDRLKMELGMCYYRNNYMLLFNYTDLSIFNSLEDEYLTFPDDDNCPNPKKTWRYLIEHQFSRFVFSKFNSIGQILDFLGHYREDGKDTIQCSKAHASRIEQEYIS